MAQVYLSQYARRAGIADTASYALNGIPAPLDTYIQYNKKGKFGADAYFRYIYPIHSFQQGNNVNALGYYSHAEGANTYTGLLNTYSSSILSGSVTLSAEYGNITSSFRIGDYIYLNDYEFDNNQGTTVAKINSTSWDGTSSYIVLDVNNIHTTTSFVGSLGTFYIQNLLGNKIARTYIAHSEGERTHAIGIGAHSEGSGSYAVGHYSHTEGNNTVALGNYQTVVGQYNIFTTSQSAFIIGDGYARLIESGNLGSSPTTGSSVFNIYSQFSPIGLLTSSIITLVSASSSVSETFPIIAVESKGFSEYEITIDGKLTQNYYDNIDTFSIVNITRHNLLFTSQSWFQVSASNVFLQGLPTSSQPYILTYEPETGQVFYTASILGGLETRDEGNTVTSNTTIFNFTGSGVSASLSGSVVNVYIPGGGGSGSAVLLNNLLTNITVGGSDSGTTYPIGTLLEDILRDILIDYIDPTITFNLLKLGGATTFNPTTDIYREVSHSLTFNTADFNATPDSPGAGRFAYSASFTASGTGIIGAFNHYFGDNVLATTNNLSVGSTRIINKSTEGPVTFTIQGAHPSSSALPNIKDEATLNYVYPIFYGMTSASYTNSGQLESDPGITKLITGESNKTLSIQGTEKYIYFAYPESYGDLLNIYEGNGYIVYDPANPNSAFIKYTFPQSGSTYPWGPVNYNVYKSRYITAVNPAQNYLFKFN
jgi:hypothetical protein